MVKGDCKIENVKLMISKVGLHNEELHQTYDLISGVGADGGRKN
jgi:hypothetical protein